MISKVKPASRRAMQPHRPNLHRALDEVNRLLDGDLLLVLDHHSAHHQACDRHGGAEQHDAIKAFGLADNRGAACPAQCPSLVFIGPVQGEGKVTPALALRKACSSRLSMTLRLL